MQPNVTPVSTKGIIIALLLIVLMLATIFLKMDPKNPIQYVGIVIYVGGIIWSVINYGKQIDYNGTYGNYFTHGFKVAALVTVIMIIFLAVLIFVYPEYKQMMMDNTREALDKNKDLTSDQKDQYLVGYSKLFVVTSIGFTLLFYMFMGVIASLLGAAFTKRNPRPVSEYAQDDTQQIS